MTSKEKDYLTSEEIRESKKQALEFLDSHYFYAASDIYKNILENMSYTDMEFEQGFIQGLIWSSLLMSKCKQYIGDAE